MKGFRKFRWPRPTIPCSAQSLPCPPCPAWWAGTRSPRTPRSSSFPPPAATGLLSSSLTSRSGSTRVSRLPASTLPPSRCTRFVEEEFRSFSSPSRTKLSVKSCRTILLRLLTFIVTFQHPGDWTFLAASTRTCPPRPPRPSRAPSVLSPGRSPSFYVLLLVQNLKTNFICQVLV